ncbi:hypothetical protein AGMMS49944_07330 [Spirochaetia bacterium]|nr:hypothetical protein AGMMS49944_07330 [Spirochaetia bacterium]
MRCRAWAEEFFAKRPDVTIVAENSGHWNKDEGMRYMEDWVQAYPQIDAVISMNDNMAMGALEAVKGNAKFAKLLAYGVDGDAGAALLIKEGTLTATSFQNADSLAEKITAMANDILTGKQTTIVNTDIDCPRYDKDNVDELIAFFNNDPRRFMAQDHGLPDEIIADGPFIVIVNIAAANSAGFYLNFDIIGAYRFINRIIPNA